MGRAAQRLSEAAAVCLVYNNCPDVVSAAGVGLLQKQAMRWWPPSHRDVHSKHLFVFLKKRDVGAYDVLKEAQGRTVQRSGTACSH